MMKEGAFGHRRTTRALLGASHRWLAYGVVALVAVAVFVAVAVPTRHAAVSLGEPSRISGYTLFALFVLLAAFNVRKRLRVLPIISAHWWTVMHVVGGLLGIALFTLHTGAWWPAGHYEQWLTALFWLVTASGVVGMVLQQYLPRRLTRTGHEVTFERIPTEVSRLKRAAEQLVLDCQRRTGHDTLARFHLETLGWYFFRPRFQFSHMVGSQAAEFWLEQQFGTVQRYLSEDELRFQQSLRALAAEKTALDAQHSGQLVLRSWLHVHVPAAGALLVLATWHVLLVHVYAL